MAKSDNLYKILGLGLAASDADIKKAYRKLALKYHPDRNNGDSNAEKKFKEISEAYSILTDTQKKEKYDAESFRSHSSHSTGGVESPFGPDFFGSDIFEHFFGKRGASHAHAHAHHNRHTHGQNITINIPISFNDSVSGCTKCISLPRQVYCNPCSGKGGSGERKCNRCKGTGYHEIHNAGLAFQTTCTQCGGQGKETANQCTTCGGQGTYEKPTEIDIKIPAGVDTDGQLRLTGMGHEGSASTGDLFVNVNIQRHPKFKRRGKDIYAVTEISVIQAVLGCVKDIETIYGLKRINIPAAVQPGGILNISGYGMPDLSGEESLKGNFKLQINVIVPSNLTEEQLRLFKQLSNLESTNNT